MLTAKDVGRSQTAAAENRRMRTSWAKSDRARRCNRRRSCRHIYGLAAPIALGYSNGANIAAAMMLLRPHVLAGGVLLRAMVPLQHPPQAALGGRPVLIISGQDPIIPPTNGARLAAMLTEAGANVDREVVNGGARAHANRPDTGT
jgi:predicted esterase